MLEKNEFITKQVLVLYATDGNKLALRNDNIVILDKEEKIIHQSTCHRLFAVFIIGNISLTTPLIQKALKHGFSICLMSSSTRVYHVIGGNIEGNTLLNKKQYKNENALEIARHIVYNKILAQRNALKSIRQKNEERNKVILKLEENCIAVKESELKLDKILGLEGTSSRIYFPLMFDNVKWNGRQPRIKADWINSTLDIGYTILFNFVEAILKMYGFDLYQGVLHQEFYKRKSLVCDLVEPFRSIIDLQIRKSINLKQISEEDFILNQNKYQLSWEKSKKYTQIFLEIILENKEDIFLYIQRYYRYIVNKKSVTELPIYNLLGGENDYSKL